MASVKEMTVRAQGVHARAMSAVKAGALVMTTGTGTGITVREFVFSHWAWFPPVVEMVGVHAVAVLVTLVVFLASAWLCVVAGCFVSVVEAIRPTVVHTPRGQARAAVRARRVR